ncbi:EcsC family protein [Mycolicibacterium frederiksbergense]|uniref:EcsC family protein n=1 Tax=Mycolicibacterium frederiksbergense TaxID=117567 RepID=A0A6H0RZ52_9MYCO|nr:EcsC family protein [Mycolicibacterium frederiksbergense]QIV80388.1 EcsC family protein [Mycolicibacterium frederiksbergense]
MGLSDYERLQLDKVREHKERELRGSARHLVPESVKETGRKLYGSALKAPGAAKLKDSGAAALKATAEGAGKFMTRTGQLTTSETRVIRSYVKKGHTVERLDDIHELDLRAIDKVASFTRLHYAYSISAATEGAAAGLAVSGGQALAAFGAVAGAGAAAAPGLGTIAAAMGVDAAALLAACSRVIAHDALYYGYDPRDPAEEVFMMQIIGLGLAVTPSAKAVAYQQLAILTRSLATNVAWRQLNQQTFVKVVQRFATQFGQKLTKKKLGQFVPIAGVGIGAALNWKMVDDVASAAYWAYRERFLFDKGGEIRPVVIDAEVDKSGVAEDDAIDVIGILESEGVTIDNGGPITEG